MAPSAAAGRECLEQIWHEARRPAHVGAVRLANRRRERALLDANAVDERTDNAGHQQTLRSGGLRRSGRLRLLPHNPEFGKESPEPDAPERERVRPSVGEQRHESIIGSFAAWPTPDARAGYRRSSSSASARRMN